MKRVILLHYTGRRAANLKVAHRIARKILGAQRQEKCLLIDCEDVTVSDEFLSILMTAARPEKIRFCGLPVAQQHIVKSAERKALS